MRVIAVINQKGGSGKTTTAVNLAAGLAEVGKKVLLIDLDAQCSASSWCGIDGNGKGLFSFFSEQQHLSEIITKTSNKKFSIIPASRWMVGIEKALASEVGAETLLKKGVEELPQDQWDYLFIDCPPSLGILTINALVAAKELLVPVETHIMAIAGLAQLMQTYDLIKERLNAELEITGILACRVNSRTRHAWEIIELLGNNFGEKLYKTMIRENIKLAEAPSFKKTIMAYAPNSIGAEDYRALAQEFISRSN